MEKNNFAGFETLYGMVQPQKLEGEIIRDLYRVENKVEGTIDIFKVRHVSSEKALLLKRIVAPRQLDLRKLLEKSFLREVSFLQAIYSPYIAEIEDTFVIEHNYFWITEFVNGQTLEEITTQTQETTKAFSIVELVSIMEKVAQALTAIHTAGLLHSNLKPSNIIVNRLDNVVKVMDINIPCCTYIYDTVDQIKKVNRFKSPEQIEKRREANLQTDLYSFGLVFYYVLTGTFPFHGNEVQSLVQMSEKKIPVLEEVNTEVPTRLSNLVMKCLEVDRKKRPANAAIIANQLEKIRGELIAHLSNVSEYNPSFGLSMTKKLSPQESYFLKILSYLNKKSWRKQSKGAVILGRLRDKRALKPLLKIVYGPEIKKHKFLIKKTIIALGKLEHMDAIEPIKQILHTATNSGIRKACHKSLKMLLQENTYSLTRKWDSIYISIHMFYTMKIRAFVQRKIYFLYRKS